MLKIISMAQELFNDEDQTFSFLPEKTLLLEHSLISISKWESKYHIPFLGKEKKTTEQTLYYIRCMLINKGVTDDVITHLSSTNFNDINDYIGDPMTATTFQNSKKDDGTRETITSELIYYWMISFNIPMECEKWHINRLLTLIQVCNIKNAPANKLSKKDAISRQRALNDARRKKYGTKG